MHKPPPNILRPKKFGSNDRKSGNYIRRQINFVEKSIVYVEDKFIISVINRFSVEILDIEISKIINILSDHSKPIEKINMISDEILLSFYYDNTVNIWDLKASLKIFTIPNVLNPYVFTKNRYFLFTDIYNYGITVDLINKTLFKSSRKHILLLIFKKKIKLK